MKTIGLIGGMSWESTVTYYRIINRLVQERLGGFHSAKCILHSVDFHEIEACQRAGDWERSGELLAEAARGLERAGADCVLICTNTMHKVADAVQSATSLPLLHIAELTADELEAAGVSTVGLLGTRYTMEQDFYTRKLVERGITVRRCKSCGRYFPQTGRVSAEYCERSVAEGQQTCRERGASQAWELKRSNDLVFKAYRREYKKRFARIKAGKLTQEEFSAWSEQAREMKKKCDREVITLDEFKDWLAKP